MDDVRGAGSSVVGAKGVRKMLSRKGALSRVGEIRVDLKNGRKAVSRAQRGDVGCTGGLHEMEGVNGIEVRGREDGLVAVAVTAVVDVGHNSAGRAVAAAAIADVARRAVLGIDDVAAWIVREFTIVAGGKVVGPARVTVVATAVVKVLSLSSCSLRALDMSHIRCSFQGNSGCCSGPALVAPLSSPHRHFLCSRR